MVPSILYIYIIIILLEFRKFVNYFWLFFIVMVIVMTIVRNMVIAMVVVIVIIIVVIVRDMVMVYGYVFYALGLWF